MLNKEESKKMYMAENQLPPMISGGGQSLKALILDIYKKAQVEK